MKEIQQKAAGNVDLGTEEWIEQYGRFVYGLAFRLRGPFPGDALKGVAALPGT